MLSRVSHVLPLDLTKKGLWKEQPGYVFDYYISWMPIFNTHIWLAPIGYHKVVRLNSILLHNKDPDMDSLLDMCFSPAAHV